MEAETFRSRIEAQIRRHDLIEPGGEITCLVSGGADSTCLWHVLRELGYRVSAVHVNHGLRGDESDEDARHCVELMAAEVVDARATGPSGSEPQSPTEAALRETAGAWPARSETGAEAVERLRGGRLRRLHPER